MRRALPNAAAALLAAALPLWPAPAAAGAPAAVAATDAGAGEGAACPDHWPLGEIAPTKWDVRTSLAVGGVLAPRGASFMGGGAGVAARLYVDQLVLLGDLTGMGGAAIDPAAGTTAGSGSIDASAFLGAGLQRIGVARYRAPESGAECHQTERRRLFFGFVAGLRTFWVARRGAALGGEGGAFAELAGARSGRRLGALLTAGYGTLVDDIPGNRSETASGGARARIWFSFEHLVLWAEASYFATTLSFVGGAGVALGTIP
jgi:hypothetical protein